MKIQVDYGRTGLRIEVPEQNLRAVLGLCPAAPLPDPDARVRESLEQPIGVPPLETLARSCRSACILICDITRPVPNEVLLQPTLQLLEKSGIPREGILILVATGLHRASTPGELREMLGPQISSQYRVECHDARDLSSHTDLGATRTGAPVFVDRRYLEADLKIAVGLIEPHLMAGFSGGRKVICPGVVAVETLKHFHGVAILQSPLATAGRVEGNPVHAFSLEVAQMAGCDFILNAALDDQRRITGIFGGHLVQAWEQGVAHVRSIAEAPLQKPVDIVVTSSAGYPLDGTFYQSVKGLVGAMPAVRPGGTIIMAAAMHEGIGSPDLVSLLESYSTIEELVEALHQPGFFSIDQWQAQELGNVCRHASVVVYSDNIPPHVLSQAFVTPTSSPEAAIAHALERYGKNASIAVIPRGPYVLPLVG